MIINRRSGMMKGKGWSVGDNVILYSYKGRQAARSMAKSIRMPATDKNVKNRDTFTQITNYSLELTGQQRAEWATTFPNNAYEREVNGNVRYPSFQLSHSIAPCSWRSGFIFCNLLAANSEMSWPRFKPLIVRTGWKPGIPSVASAALDTKNWKINGEVKIFYIREGLKENRLRIWVALQYVSRITGYVCKIVDLGAGPQKDVVVPFSIDIIRTAGFRYGIEYLKLSDILFGTVYLYADCVGAHGQEWGPLVSTYSNVRQIIMPSRVSLKKVLKLGKSKMVYIPKQEYAQSVSKISLKVLNNVRVYKKAGAKRKSNTKIIIGTDWEKHTYK